MKAFNQSKTLFSVQALTLLLSFTTGAQTRQRRPPQGGRIAIVVDERLSALRATPDLSGRLLQRISRGRLVAILARRLTSDGILFYRVRVTRRTQGWLQKEALVSASLPGADRTLLRLIQSSQEFDRLARAKIFLDAFPHSPLRPQVLLLYAETAEISAARLSREAARRLDLSQESAGAPEASYFLNYSGLDRYNRQGVRFVFDRRARQFHYDGRAWREIVARYPRSPEAVEARKRLDSLTSISSRRIYPIREAAN